MPETRPPIHVRTVCTVHGCDVPCARCYDDQQTRALLAKVLGVKDAPGTDAAIRIDMLLQVINDLARRQAERVMQIHLWQSHGAPP